MCLHYVILVSLAELEQLRRGLAIQKFNSLMLSQKQLGKPLHHQSKKYQVISSRICTLLYFHLLEATKGHRREHHDVMGAIPAVCGRWDYVRWWYLLNFNINLQLVEIQVHRLWVMSYRMRYHPTTWIWICWPRYHFLRYWCFAMCFNMLSESNHSKKFSNWVGKIQGENVSSNPWIAGILWFCMKLYLVRTSCFIITYSPQLYQVASSSLIQYIIHWNIVFADIFLCRASRVTVTP